MPSSYLNRQSPSDPAAHPVGGALQGAVPAHHHAVVAQHVDPWHVAALKAALATQEHIPRRLADAVGIRPSPHQTACRSRKS
jgi:hypothetical protein